mmetsp:Transcript_5542/g.14167  ORF Transcript_5542/g.14167 Transcript_5542/m.14167 type:complete len:234 (-) Transcript_5542:760-1461(-)
MQYLRQCSLCDLVNGRSDVPDIGVSDARHRDAPVVGDVDGVLRAQPKDLLLSHARVAEHADLVCHVVPRALRAKSLELGAQRLAHRDDSVCHALALGAPLGREALIAEDAADDARAVHGRVGVHRPDEHLKLTLHALCLIPVRADHREHAHALAVQPEVLGKRLAERHPVASLTEESHGVRVVLGITAGEALICRVEEDVQVLLRAQVRDLRPLLVRRVDTSGVVRAGMQQNH